MLILGLDSAGGSCGACVWRDGTVLALMHESMERGQDQRLMPLILETMKKAGVEFDALDRIAVTRGPGSFTGLRIGLAAARGIGLASGKPVIGVDRFATFRAQVADATNVLVVIQSKRKELFCKFFPVNGTPDKPFIMTLEEIQDFLKDKPGTVVIGDVPLVGIECRIPLEKETITAASIAATAKPDDADFLPRPLYLREADVTIKAS